MKNFSISKSSTVMPASIIIHFTFKNESVNVSKSFTLLSQIFFLAVLRFYLKLNLLHFYLSLSICLFNVIIIKL